MAYEPTFAIDCIGRDPGAMGKAALGRLAAALVDVNAEYIRTYPDTFASVYESGFVIGEPLGRGGQCGDRRWQDVAVMKDSGIVKPDDLVMARVAELNVQHDIKASVRVYSNDDGLYELLVEWPRVLPVGAVYPESVYAHPLDGALVESPSEAMGSREKASFVAPNRPYRITLAVDCIGEDHPEALRMALDHCMGYLLHALTDIDVMYLRAFPDRFALLYDSCVRYDRMSPPPSSVCGDDDWQDIVVTYDMCKGDCEDVACIRAAEVNVHYSIPVVPMVMLQQNQSPGARTRHLYHVMDRWPDGLGKYPPSVFADETDQGMMMMECPSTVLGMTGDEEAAQ